MEQADEGFRRRFQQARCIFFDCDGVILDSNGMKLSVLREVLACYPTETHGPMLDYWKRSGGQSRYAKFAHFAQEILRAAEPERAAAKAIERFGTLTRAAYEGLSPLPDAVWLMRAAGQARCFVVSGTDQAELREVFDQKGLRALCADVLGSPQGKVAHIESVLASRSLTADDALFIGDGGGDFAACRQTGVHFVYLAEMSEWTQAQAQLSGADNVTWAKSLSSLRSTLQSEPSHATHAT